MKNCNIVILYKKIKETGTIAIVTEDSLLIILRKVFARVVLGRLQKLAERIYPEFQG